MKINENRVNTSFLAAASSSPMLQKPTNPGMAKHSLHPNKVYNLTNTYTYHEKHKNGKIIRWSLQLHFAHSVLCNQHN